MRFLGFRFNFRRLSPAATTVYCQICMEHVPSASSFKTTAQCKHSFCGSCLSSYITINISVGVAKIPCPGLQCQAMLEPLHCKELVSSKSFIAWGDLLCESYILGLVTCECPNLRCREVIVNECGWKGKAKRFKCPRCRRNGCFQCAAVWTEGHRCGSAQDVDLSLLERLANAKKWTRCPNCHTYVERKGGCAHIYCRCRTRFCHECGEKNDSRPCSCAKSQMTGQLVERVNVTLLLGLSCFYFLGAWTRQYNSS